MTLESRTLSVSINRHPDEVYPFVSNPDNLPQWAPAFCKSVRKAGAEWIVETADGPVKIRFVETNAFRVADHYVIPTPDSEIYVPMRVLPNGSSGSELLLTLFRQPNMSEQEFRRDIEMVTRDLNVLKKVLEK
jgi:hypothetical protein